MIEQILRAVMIALGALIVFFVLRTLYLCLVDRFLTFPRESFFNRRGSQYDYLADDVIREAKELFARVENGEVKKESLGNEALPEDGKQTSIAFQAMLDSPNRVKMITSIKEKAYYEEY